MLDRETVITHLQIIHTWAEFARERDLQFFTAKHLEDIAQWSDDAIELLKEQENTRLDITHEMVSNSILMYQGKEIVRCKDCKHYVEGGPCRYMDVYPYPEPEWFCASGERREK